MTDEKILLTREGLDKIKLEYDELVSIRRAEVADKIREARSYGDLSENAEYDAAKEEQAELEERIHKLETTIRNAVIVSEEEMSKGTVNIGLSVKVKDLDSGDEEIFTLVGSTEADPFEGKISNMSAVGSALMGKAGGDEAEVQIPDGVIRYKVLEVSK